jgi:hypothetical protein
LRRASLLALPLLLSGCSGTPFGETLSRSFSGVPTPAPTPSPAGAPAARPAPASPSGATAKVSPNPAAPAAPPAATPAPAAPAAPRPANPAPYRVTILLPQADPAAPAEVLTRALRTAGVPFEVETIQRTAPGDTPRAAPAPAAPATPVAPAAPSVRPAPAPR